MYSTSVDSSSRKNRFGVVIRSFLHSPGLPFAGVLTAGAIEQAFAQHGGLFALNDIFSAPLVLWAFLAQVLRGGKCGACAAAVADIATYLCQLGRRPPSGDTGDYCRARAKLKVGAVRQLARETAAKLQQAARPQWLWHGLHAKLIDGFTFTMPDNAGQSAGVPAAAQSAARGRHPHRPGLRGAVFGHGRHCRCGHRTLPGQADRRERPVAPDTAVPLSGRTGRLRPLLLFLHVAGQPAPGGDALLHAPAPVPA